MSIAVLNISENVKMKILIIIKKKLRFENRIRIRPAQSIGAMERCVEEIRTWMLTDKLSLNDNNTEFLIIGTKQQLSKISPCHLTIGSATVSPVNSARNLGT